MLRRVSYDLLRNSVKSVPCFAAQKRAFVGARFLSSSIKTSSSSIPIETEESEDSSPWYLREEESSSLTTPIFKSEMPEIPENSPDFMLPMMEELIDLGLDDLKVFDLRGREEDIPMAQHVEFVVVCQGKSSKHLQNAAGRLVVSLKKVHNVLPYVEGLIKPNSSLRMKRKLKQKKPDNDFGLGVNSWIMVDTQMGLFVNLLTPERRSQVNLEYLWCKPEERSLYEPKEISSNSENDSVFAGIFRRFYSTRQEVPLETAALQTFELMDITKFSSEVAPSLFKDPELALRVLQSFVDFLKSSDIDNLVKTETHDSAKIYKRFLNGCLPSQPSLQHWELRHEVLQILHMIFPSKIEINEILDSLLLQSTSGTSITAKQLIQFSEALAQSLFYNQPRRILTQSQVDMVANIKLKSFSYVLESFSTEERQELNNDVVLGILKLATQQHLYLRTDETVPVSRALDVLLEFWSNKAPSPAIVEFVLMSYLKANKAEKLWKYWDSIGSYSVDQNIAVIDSKPWHILLELLVREPHDRIINDLLNKRFREALELGLPLTTEMKKDALTILNRFDESGSAYSSIREKI